MNAAWSVVLVFGAILGIGLLSGGLTGEVTGAGVTLTSGTLLSVGAAVLAVGVLIVAGLKQES